MSSILSAIPANKGPLVIAAGGFSSGAQVASFLTLGASGVAFGTRFLLTPESPYTPAQKTALIAADSTSSVRTMAFDQARNTLAWPRGIDGRGLHNKLVEDFDSGLDVTELRDRFATHAKRGEADYMVTWAGAGVGEMHEEKDAKVRPLNPCMKVVFYAPNSTLSYFFRARTSSRSFTLKSSNASKKLDRSFLIHDAKGRARRNAVFPI